MCRRETSSQTSAATCRPPGWRGLGERPPYRAISRASENNRVSTPQLTAATFFGVASFYNGARTGLATMAAEAPNPDLVLRWPPWLAARRARERRQHPRTTHDGAILNTPSELLWTKPYADSAVAVLW